MRLQNLPIHIQHLGHPLLPSPPPPTTPSPPPLLPLLLLYHFRAK